MLYVAKINKYTLQMPQRINNEHRNLNY